MKRNSVIVWSAILAGLLAPCSGRAQIAYSLANDWSDTVNPNGAWAYNAAPGMPLATGRMPPDPGSQRPVANGRLP